MHTSFAEKSFTERDLPFLFVQRRRRRNDVISLLTSYTHIRTHKYSGIWILYSWILQKLFRLFKACTCRMYFFLCEMFNKYLNIELNRMCTNNFFLKPRQIAFRSKTNWKLLTQSYFIQFYIKQKSVCLSERAHVSWLILITQVLGDMDSLFML